MEAPTDITGVAVRRQETSRNSWTLWLVLLVALAVTSAILVKFRQERLNHGAPAVDGSGPAAWTPPPDSQMATVSLEIDFGNGARREFAALPWSAGMTVADILERAAAFGPGLTFSQQGSGAGAFLSSVDGVTGDASIGRFWIYEINGKAGDVSFAAQPVAAGDRVLWAFKQPE